MDSFDIRFWKTRLRFAHMEWNQLCQALHEGRRAQCLTMIEVQNIYALMHDACNRGIEAERLLLGAGLSHHQIYDW